MRSLRRLGALLLLAAGGCASIPCPCDDPENRVRRPGRDGRDSALLVETPPVKSV